jgi:hypothetical protein
MLLQHLNPRKPRTDHLSYLSLSRNPTCWQWRKLPQVEYKRWEMEEGITDIHHNFWVHCVPNSWPHNVICLNSMCCFGRKIHRITLTNTYLSRLSKQADKLLARNVHNDLLNLTIPQYKLNLSSPYLDLHYVFPSEKRYWNMILKQRQANLHSIQTICN